MCILKNRGFTLIEVLAVLLLLGLGSFIVLPTIDRGLREREIKRSALELAAVARDLRGRALYESIPQRLILNSVDNSYQVFKGKKIILSSDVKISEIQGGEPIGDGLRQFLFFPNGTILGGEVGISARDGVPAYRVRFEALTGRIGIAQSRAE